LCQRWRSIVRRAGRATITDESEIQISAERGVVSDSNNDRDSSFASSLLFIDLRSLIAVSDVSPVFSPAHVNPHVHTRARGCTWLARARARARVVTRVWVVCAQMSAGRRSLRRRSSRICICMGKKNHPSRSRPSGVGSGGRTMFRASFLYGRARHKIDERL